MIRSNLVLKCWKLYCKSMKKLGCVIVIPWQTMMKTNFFAKSTRDHVTGLLGTNDFVSYSSDSVITSSQFQLSSFEHYENTS